MVMQQRVGKACEGAAHEGGERLEWCLVICRMFLICISGALLEEDGVLRDDFPSSDLLKAFAAMSSEAIFVTIAA